MASEFNADDILEVSTSGYKSCPTSGPTIIPTSGPTIIPTSGPVSGLFSVFTSDSAFGSVIPIGS